MKKTTLVVALLFCVVPSLADKSVISTSYKELLAADGAASDEFGNSVAVSGDTMVIGAPGDDDNGSASGSAYIFERNEGGADNWGQVAKLTASDGALSDKFGWAVAISGDRIVIGAPENSAAETKCGAVYIFERNEGGPDNWGQAAKLTATDAVAYDYLGYSVGLSGDTIVAGAWGVDDVAAAAGAAYIFERNEGGADNWGQVRKITPSDGETFDSFGTSVAISDDTAVVGSPHDDDNGTYSGSAYIFQRNQGGVDNWGLTRKITSEDVDYYDYFGYAVAVGGDTVAVGAWGNDDAGDNSGSAYIFERNEGGMDNWGQVKKILATDGEADDNFGYSLAVDGSNLIVGSPRSSEVTYQSGSAYVYERGRGGEDNWGEVRLLKAGASTSGNRIGHAVAASVDTMVAGAPLSFAAGNRTGSAWLFTVGDCGWSLLVVKHASDTSYLDYFGEADISGDTVVVGAPGDMNMGEQTGSAYIFEDFSLWEVAKLTAPDGAADDSFGVVAISGDTVAVGAPGDDDMGNNSGSVYLFERNRGGADSWGFVTKITVADGDSDDQFGLNLDISGDMLVVGAWYDDDNGTNSGSAYLFERNRGGADNWGQVAKLTASDGAAFDCFGVDVAIAGDIVIIGAYGDDDNGDSSGSAYVFERNQGGADNWGEVAKLTASDGTQGDQFGESVAIDGGAAVVGADDDWYAGAGHGSAYVFERNQGGADNWGEVTKLTPSDTPGLPMSFGEGVAIDADRIVVAAPYDSDTAFCAGALYVFERNEGGADNWGQAVKLTLSGADDNERLGLPYINISGRRIVARSLTDDLGTASGSCVIFSLPDPPDWYFDSDNDDYGDPLLALEACTQPSQYVENGFDCDDDDADTYPYAPQLCDEVNNDCFDPDWPVLPASEIDDDSDGELDCEGDCNDADGSINSSASESCDGYDNDCDDSLDEGCDGLCDAPENLGADTRVTDDGATSSAPEMVWTGSEYAVVWSDNRPGNTEIHFAKLNSVGEKTTADIRVSYGSGGSEEPELAWTGTEFGVAWHDERHGNWEIYFARVDAAGNPIGGEVRITETTTNSVHVADVIWTGMEYALLWRDKRHGNWELYFARVDPSGNKIGDEVRLTFTPAYSSEASMVWTGSAYGVAWNDIPESDWEIYFELLVFDQDGLNILHQERVTNSAYPSWYPSLAWSGSEFGIAWRDSRDGNDEIYFARIDDLGTVVPGSETRITSDTAGSQLPSIAWNGTEYGVTWHDNRDGGTEIYFTRISAAGIEQGDDVRVTNDPWSSEESTLVWTGDRYAVAWSDYRPSNWEIYFTPIDCCDDIDSDGWSECYDCDDGDDTVYPDAHEYCDYKDNDCDELVDETFLEPGETTGVSFGENKQLFSWTTTPGADSWDVVQGHLASLLSSGGDYEYSMDDCIENDLYFPWAEALDDPGAGQGFYYLVRGVNVCVPGSYDTSGPGQYADRDDGVNSSWDACP